MVSGWLNASKVTFKYKERYSFERRKAEASKVRRTRPNLVPLIVEKGFGEEIDDLPNHKFLVACDMTLAEFQAFIRKRIRITEDRALFLFLNGSNLISMSQTMQAIYEQYHEDDLFLYLTYGQENTFG